MWHWHGLLAFVKVPPFSAVMRGPPGIENYVPLATRTKSLSGCDGGGPKPFSLLRALMAMRGQGGEELLDRQQYGEPRICMLNHRRSRCTLLLSIQHVAGGSKVRLGAGKRISQRKVYPAVGRCSPTTPFLPAPILSGHSCTGISKRRKKLDRRAARGTLLVIMISPLSHGR